MADPARNYAPAEAPTQPMPAVPGDGRRLEVLPGGAAVAGAPAPGASAHGWFVRNALLVAIISTALALLAVAGAVLTMRASPEREFGQLAAPTAKELQAVLDDARSPDGLKDAADDLGRLGRDVGALAVVAAKAGDPAYGEVGEQLASTVELLEELAATPRAKVEDSMVRDAEGAVDDLNDAIDAWNAKHGKGGTAIGEVDADRLIAAQVENRKRFRDEVAAREKQRKAAQAFNQRSSKTRNQLRGARTQFQSIAGRYEATRSATAAWAAGIESRWWNELSVGDFAGLDAQIRARQQLLAEVNALAAESPASVRGDLSAYAGILSQAIQGLSAAYAGMTETASLFTMPLVVEQSPAWHEFEAVSRSIGGRLTSSRKNVVRSIDGELRKHKTKPVPPKITE